MFEIKKIIGALLMPLPLLGLISFICLLLSLRGSKFSGIISLLCITCLLAISTPFIGQLIIDPTSQLDTRINLKKHPIIDKIVVLGCDLVPNPALSANSQLGNCANSRLIEGVRLAYHYPQAQLIVSGGGYAKVTNSHLMYQTAINLGISAARIKQNPDAMDTADEARLLAPSLVDFKVALVTSANHMPRARNLFYAQGVETIPAATDFNDYAQLPLYKQFIPSAKVLKAVTSYWHEVIGTMWISIRRLIEPTAI